MIVSPVRAGDWTAALGRLHARHLAAFDPADLEPLKWTILRSRPAAFPGFGAFELSPGEFRILDRETLETPKRWKPSAASVKPSENVRGARVVPSDQEPAPGGIPDTP